MFCFAVSCFQIFKCSPYIILTRRNIQGFRGAVKGVDRVNEKAVQPRCAADTAGAVRGLGAIYPAKRAGLLAT
jgi:hypothetical protein